MTKDAGESVKLKCEANGDPTPTKIKWYKNEAPLLEEKGRLTLRKYKPRHQGLGSRLRITELTTHDMGFYKCQVSNGKEKIDTQGILIVRYGGKWGKTVHNLNFNKFEYK